MDKKILDKIKKLKKNERFLMTLTVFNGKKAGDNLDTFLVANNFPYEEFGGTKKMICKLIDEQSGK